MSKYAVKTLYPDGVESPYRAAALPMFASLCLTVGALLVLFRTWDEVPVPLWELLLALVTGYAFAVLGRRLGRRHMAFQLLRLVPWIPAALMPSACARGIVAWLSMLHLRWNLLHDGSARLYQSGASAFDERAAVFVGTVLIAQAAQLLVVHRCRLLTIGMCIFWMPVGLATGGFSPVGAALLLAGTLAVCVSDISLHLTPAAWRTLGILLSLLVLAAFLPDMDMPFVQGLREDAKQQVHKLRYGEETQPDGELAKAAMLHSDNHVMLYVTSGQEKTLYLRGYTAGVYEDGAWVPLHGMAYTGDYSGMMRWLRNNGFDPARQPAQYLSLCADSDAESNDVTVEAVWAARDELYLPGSTSELRGAKAKENSRDSTNKARGLFGARRYGVSELSGSRPAELTVAEEWVNDPETPAQQTYLANEAVYRSFVYDNYTEVSDALLPTLDRLFWDGYSGENDGIYSAVSRVREVLRNQMTYAETPAAAPEGEDPLAWFLTEGREGNAVQYASAAVEALRAHGIPARYCEGYLLTAADVRSAGGKTISLTGENAHAWCEAYFDGVGWLPVDVTPGFYYDALALQQLVSLPDSVHRTAAMEDTNDSAGEVSGTGENGGEKLRDLMHNAAHTAGILLGILAVLLVLLTLCILVFEGVLLLCRVHVFRTLKKASPEDRARWTAWWGEKLLAARGIDASLGWHTDETDARLASMIDSVNPGEYRRVCQLLEKAIYGGIELKSYEERTIRSLLERVRFAPMPDLTTRMRVHCLFLNHLRRCHRKK